MKAIILLQEFRKIKVGNYFVGYQELKEEVQSKIDKAIKELEELENRSCSNCKYVYIDTLGFNYCENPISPLSSCIFALHPSFCCNKWENKQ